MLRLGERLDHWLEDLADVLAGSFQIVIIRDAAFRQELARHAASSGRNGQRDGRVLVGAHGHFERAAADVDDEQTTGIPAIPTAGGQEGESGLIHAGQHGDRLADGLFDLA